MSGRSNWEFKNLLGMKSTGEPKTPSKEKREPVLPGLNPMGVRGSARKAKIDQAIDEATK